MWEPSLLAMTDDAVLQLNRVAPIASKLGSDKNCSHSGFCVALEGGAGLCSRRRALYPCGHFSAQGFYSS